MSRPCPVQSDNEWDPLEEVIVGSVQGAMYPEFSPILAANGDPDWLWHYQGMLMEETFVEDANAQLDVFISLLEEAGVRVRRPDAMPHNIPFSTPYWQARGGWNSANPRDLFLVVGDEIIECASPLRHRHFESLAYRRLLKEYFERGARWTAAPRPALREPLYDHSFLAQPNAPHGDHDRRRELAPDEPHRYPITEHEPVFEAADFVRCGRDLFVTRSIVTNALGIEWVRRHLGDAYRVHELQTRCASPWHIDTTFIPLRPGCALINPAWFVPTPALRDWELIPAPRPTYGPDSPMAHPFFSSQWLSMNVFSLDARRVFVDAQQTQLLRLLEARGFEPIPVHFDAVGRFGGSFHCVTLDVRRRSALDPSPA